MNKLPIILMAVALASCGPAPAPATEDAANDITHVRGMFQLTRASGGGLHEIRTFTIDGTRCIYVGRYSAISLSCDWKTP